MASVALRMAIKNSEYKVVSRKLQLSFDIFPCSQVHFDYFSVDFDEEHSAFYGGVLNDQV